MIDRGAVIDMELTPERAKDIKETLIRLYAHQHGIDLDNLEVTITPVVAERTSESNAERI